MGEHGFDIDDRGAVNRQTPEGPFARIVRGYAHGIPRQLIPTERLRGDAAPTPLAGTILGRQGGPAGPPLAALPPLILAQLVVFSNVPAAPLHDVLRTATGTARSTHYSQRRKTTAAFWPPKPKVWLRATRIGTARASLGT